MEKLPENFCIAPFVQLTTHPTSSFSPCPYLGGTVWGGEYSTIFSQWRSSDLESLRDDFINNNQSPICERCWNEERNGKESLRKRLFNPETHISDFETYNTDEFKNSIVDKVNSKSYLKTPEVLTIKNGNVCNAKCRTCHPNDSSRWIKDSKELEVITNKQYYRTDVKEKNWSDTQIVDLILTCSHIKRLELFGGEPTYNKKVIYLLEEITKRGYSKNIVLYINTNGSVDITKKIPFLYEFKEVEVGVSIDAVGKQFNYIRHGIDYDNVKQNVIRMKKYFERNGMKYSIDCICTVQIQNIFYLPEIKEEILSYLPSSPFWNLLINPSYLYIRNIPDKFKQPIVDKLSSDSEYTDLIQILKQPSNSSDWESFIEVTKGLDLIRNEEFASIFPEFNNITKIFD